MTPRELLALPQNTRVRVLQDINDDFKPGQIIYRDRGLGCDECSSMFTARPDGNGQCGYMMAEEVELVVEEVPPCNATDISTGRSNEQLCEDLGIFRPELETRKIGKIRVELVDDGFPLALREVAKVMTWAQTAKGYKDHDWQNLPNAEVSLAAAASRHRTDHIEQRVVNGFDIVDCVDIESSLLHKAHEAFGVLAQLELMCRGKFL